VFERTRVAGSSRGAGEQARWPSKARVDDLRFRNAFTPPMVATSRHGPSTGPTFTLEVDWNVEVFSGVSCHNLRYLRFSAPSTRLAVNIDLELARRLVPGHDKMDFSVCARDYAAGRHVVATRNVIDCQCRLQGVVTAGHRFDESMTH
jgi:hypothetical protein